MNKQRDYKLECHRHRLTAVLAYATLTTRPDEWVSAVDLTQTVEQRMPEVGLPAWQWSYRPIAFALRRLVKCGLARERTTFYRSKHKANEPRREYQLITAEEEQARDIGTRFFPKVVRVSENAPRRVIRTGGTAR